MLQNYHTEISVCSASVNRMQCRRHNMKQWNTEYKVRRAFTWRHWFTSGQKFCEFSILFTSPLHFSFQLSSVLNQLSSTIHSSPKNRFIDFPPNFRKQIEVSKTSVQIWIHFMITVHFFRSSRMLKFCCCFLISYIFYSQVNPSSTQTPRLSSRLSLFIHNADSKFYYP